MTKTKTNSERPFPLANDANGDPLKMPAEASAWRVRKMPPRAGRPKVLFDPETGRQLEVPLATTVHELAEIVGEPGRYRLEAIDREGRLIPDYVAFTQIFGEDGEDEAETMTSRGDVVSQMVQLLSHMVDANTRVMQAMASAFGTVHPQPHVVVEQPAATGPTPAAQMNMQDILTAVKGIAEMRAPRGPTNGAGSASAS